MLAAPRCFPRKTLLNSEIMSGFAERNWLMISGNQLRAARALVGCDQATILRRLAPVAHGILCCYCRSGLAARACPEKQRQQERDSASPLEGEHDWKIRTGLRAYLA